MISLKPDNGWIALDETLVRYPWYTSGALEVIDKIDFRGKSVFEYGVGFSTAWYISRGATCRGVDNKHYWAEVTNSLLVEDFTHYTQAILDYPYLFDLIVIDGEYRDNCTEFAIQRIAPGGLVIIDNWMQPSVPPNEWFRTCDLLAVKGFPHTVYKQEGHPDWSTLIIQC